MFKIFENNILKNILLRHISSSQNLNGRSVTKESGVIPGSSEARDPEKWAKRIFDLQKSKETSKDNPHMLNLVFRLQNDKIPFYCKAILQKYDLLKKFKYQIVKNTPSINEDLLKIAQYIKVVPIKFPHGIPKESNDFLNAQLRPDGNFILHTGKVVKGSIITENDENEEISTVKNFIFDYNKYAERSLSTKNFYDENIKDWKRNRFLKGYFTTHYQYKHNQDGKEYRYSNNHRLSNSLKQSMDRRFNKDGTVRMNNNFEADWNTYPWKTF